MSSPHHTLHKLTFDFDRLTPVTVSTMHQVAFTLLLSLLALLAACSNTGDSQNTDFVEAQPISVALRPGEVEKVLFSSNAGKFIGGFNPLVDIDDAFSIKATCDVANQTCWTQEFTALDINQSARLGFYRFGLTGNGFINNDPKANNGSYLPFSVFPATTQALSPSVRFATGGYIDREGLLSDKFSDEPAHSLSVGADGSVWAWGANLSGQLGNGNNLPSPVPPVQMVWIMTATA
jgi:hypothetical protein